MGLDRKTLRETYTKDLMKDGKIKKDGNGRHGKYFPTEEVYKDPLLNATLFGDDFRFSLLGKKEDLVLCDQPIMDFDLKKQFDCTSYTSLYKPMFTSEDQVEHALFEFSNRIGAFITYALIQAMNPDNNKMSLSTRGQDEVVKKWAQNSISRMLPFLVKEFNEVAYRAVGQYPWGYDERKKFMEKRPRYVLDRPTTIRLLTAFGRLYPRLGYKFDKMIRKLPDALQNYKRFMEEMRKKWKQQEVCKHEYNVPAMTLHGYCGKQCNKCHYIARVKDSICTILSEFEKLLDDGYKIEKIRPSEFNTAAKINSLEVILISYQGEKKSIKGTGEEAQALRQFIRSLQKSSISS
jgi:hypothetical protein